jgi:hypothetical protein
MTRQVLDVEVELCGRAEICEEEPSIRQDKEIVGLDIPGVVSGRETLESTCLWMIPAWCTQSMQFTICAAHHCNSSDSTGDTRPDSDTLAEIRSQSDPQGAYWMTR